MRFRNGLIFSILLCALLLQACTPVGGTPTPMLGEPPLAPLTLYVSTSGDDSNDCLSEAAACRTVYNAIRLSTPGSTIQIGRGEFNRDGGLSPFHSINLQGAGMDRTRLTSRGDVLQFGHPGNFTVRDLTLTGVGTDVPRNSLEVREGAILLVENTRLENSYYGLRLFRGAEVTSPGGLIVEENYHGVSNRGQLSLTGTVFTRNVNGLSNYETAELLEADFNGNGAFSESSGAAAPTVDNRGEMLMRGGRVTGSRGYGITNTGGELVLEGVEVYDNDGIAVWHTEGTLEIRSSVIRDNGVYGLAVGGRGSVPDVGSVNVHETAIVRNRSAGVRIDRGRVTLENTTISGNVASTSGGGGIWMYGGDLFLLNSSVVLNTGNGILAGPAGDVPAVITARRSLVALNSAEECYRTGRSTESTGSTTYGPSPYMCTEATQSSLRLGGLTSEAGTLVHPLQSGSPLIDAGGPVALCSSVDQRGFPRPAGSTCDVGAYEAGSSTTMAVVIATAGPTPTAGILPLPTATEAAVPPFFTFLQNANCRKGPGVAYSILTSLVQGAVVDALARNEDASWYRVAVPETEATCWVAASTGEASGTIDGLPTEAGLPLPGAPGALTIGQVICSPNLNDYAVPLEWGDASNETGYRLYRNGSLLATLGANELDYDDEAPKGEELDYALEAFNQVGVSDRVAASVPACN